MDGQKWKKWMEVDVDVSERWAMLGIDFTFWKTPRYTKSLSGLRQGCAAAALQLQIHDGRARGLSGSVAQWLGLRSW